jgi:hypothetical protein
MAEKLTLAQIQYEFKHFGFTLSIDECQLISDIMAQNSLSINEQRDFYRAYCIDALKSQIHQVLIAADLRTSEQ